ncbi:MAG: ribokinase [Micrococcales bacterium]|nr:ribokinase [Micrococcales bacterium]
MSELPDDLRPAAEVVAHRARRVESRAIGHTRDTVRSAMSPATKLARRRRRRLSTGGQVCVVGSFMMDLVASAPRRPMPGETLVGTDFEMRLGGKGFNQAVAAARAGAGTSMVGVLGADGFGDGFRAALHDENINDTWVGVDETAGTGVGLPVVEPDGQNSIIIVARGNLAVDAAYVEAAREAIAAAHVLTLQLELPIASAIAAARIAHQAGTVVVLNPAPMSAVPAELLENVDLLVPNEIELDALVGHPVGEDVEAAATGLGARTDVDVVVTLGSRGVVVAARGKSATRLDAPRVTAVDTVGAGDVFCGYLAAGLAEQCELAEAVCSANSAAALSVTRTGSATAAPRRSEVSSFAATSTLAGT